MKPIHVVHICDKFGMRGSTTHGVSRSFAYQFPMFDPSKFKITLYGVKTPDAASRAAEEMGMEIKYLNHTKLSPDILSNFLRVIREEKADVLHLHGWIASNFGRLAGRIAKVPAIMHEHGVDPKFPLSQKIVDRFLSKYTDIAMSVSESVGTFMVEHRYIRPEIVRVIRSGVPMEKFARASDEEISNAKQSLNIPVDSPVIGTIGRLDVQKGNTYFLQAAKNVLSEVPNAYFLVIGDGPKRGELEEESRSLGIDDKVIFTGHRSDIILIMSVLTVQAFPSLWEGTPHSVYEALAMGQTMVSTPVDGLGEVLKDGHSAIFVEPENVEQLATGIIKLLSDKALAEQLSKNAKEESKKYDVMTTVSNLGALYEELYFSRQKR